MDLKQPPTNNMMDPSKYSYADDSVNKQDNQAKDNASKKKSGPSGDLFAILSVLFQLFVLVVHIGPFIESLNTEYQSAGIYVLAFYYYHLPLLIIGGVLQHVASKEAKKLRPLIHVASALFVIALIIIIWTYINIL